MKSQNKALHTRMTKYTPEERSEFAKKAWRTMRRQKQLNDLQDHFTKDESRYHVLHAQDEVLEGLDMQTLDYRMATLPCSQLRFEKLLLKRCPWSQIDGAEIDSKVAKEARKVAKILGRKYPSNVPVLILNDSFAQVVSSSTQGYHSIWFDCCSPMRSTGFNKANPGELDPANSIDRMFKNENLFKPAFDLGIPGQMFITIMNKRDDIGFMAKLARDHGFEWKSNGKTRKGNDVIWRHNRYARIAAMFQKVQMAAERAGLMAVPCLAMLYSGAKGRQNCCSPMSVVGLNIYRPKNAKHRKELQQRIEECKGLIIDSTIVIGD